MSCHLGTVGVDVHGCWYPRMSFPTDARMILDISKLNPGSPVRPCAARSSMCRRVRTYISLCLLCLSPLSGSTRPDPFTTSISPNYPYPHPFPPSLIYSGDVAESCRSLPTRCFHLGYRFPDPKRTRLACSTCSIIRAPRVYQTCMILRECVLYLSVCNLDGREVGSNACLVEVPAIPYYNNPIISPGRQYGRPSMCPVLSPPGRYIVVPHGCCG
ncbi:hypothetical protein C8Q77DRAFT_261610 [Trametes polyzona]|nr:hypothetical protein C8Q77DRAFT_261610 [Trametes polyzona]